MTEYNNYNATKTTTTLAMAMATVGGRSKAGGEGAISGARSRLLSPCYMSSPINCNRTGHTRKNKKYLLAWQILKEFLESANVRSECQKKKLHRWTLCNPRSSKQTLHLFVFSFCFLAVLAMFVFALDVVKVSLCVFLLFFFYRADVDSHWVFSRNFVWNISIYVSVCKFSYLYLPQLYLP